PVPGVPHPPHPPRGGGHPPPPPPGGPPPRVDDEVEAVLDTAVRFARDSPKPDPSEALDCLYATGLRPRAGVTTSA
ncbi:hypothetical protein ACFVZ2_41585, partial [Streptomyces lasiicapitis]